MISNLEEIYKIAKQQKAKVIAITGTKDSMLAKEADDVLLTYEGPEKTYPKTKSVISALGLLFRLAISFAKIGQSRSRVRRLSRHAARLPCRLPPELPRRPGQGRLEENAGVVQETRRLRRFEQGRGDARPGPFTFAAFRPI